MFKSRITYVVLAFLFGAFGIHDFYAKRKEHAWAILGSYIAICIGTVFSSLVVLLIFPLYLFILYEILTVRFDGTGKIFVENYLK